MAWKAINATLLLILAGCGRFPPDTYDNHICQVVQSHWGWAKPLRHVSEEYHISPGLVLSVIFHESSFRAQARPERKSVLGFVPWTVSSAYGYGQIKDETWAWYKSHRPGYFQSRTQFSDTVDFIGWYYQIFRRKNPLESFNDMQVARDFYFAYHEGLGGYQRKTYASQAWLINKAERVAKRASEYNQQLVNCL
ncbi:hypothetical protein [Candidatus Synchoanobacter obligatus]|uniref:Transglycosylase SLT domain-containing protein n=1 Tax=Candidatus Synchoanobacter obligatus TaxID=2919597 RepID=A0ABT1L610_9GAMM|nr:hypothetical protein [Candidatus Synchoanobacter obligatus]MCP8352625.1 hypothetical protein [Candidatus Synchoanobacter obligatus]